MKTTLRHLLCIALLGSIVIHVKDAVGQINPYDNNMMPYENQSTAGLRMGGISVAIPDKVPNVVGNPASLTHITRPVLFVSTNNVAIKQNFVNIINEDQSEHKWNQGFLIGYSAGLLPFMLFKKPWAAAASYNGIYWPEFDERFVSDANPPWDYKIDQTGTIKSASLALAVRVSSVLSMGVGWTKWFGTTTRDNGFTTASSLDYNGQSWKGGIRAEFGRISFGSVVHFPLSLMTGNNLSKTYMIDNQLYISQKFNGAVDFGFGYQLQSDWIISVDYGYYRSSKIEYQTEEQLFYFTTKGFSKTSCGVEYRTKFWRVDIPIYVGITAFWFQKSEPSDVLFLIYPQMVRSGIDLLSSEIVFGTALEYKSMGFFMDTRFAQNSYRLIEPGPPWS